MYQLICMSFDGDYQTEKPEFETIDETWDYANNLGSRWYFYPFYFVIETDEKKIADTGSYLEHLIGLTLEIVSGIFLSHSENPEMDGADYEAFAITI